MVIALMEMYVTVSQMYKKNNFISFQTWNELSTHYSPDISSLLQGTFSTLNYEQNGTEWPQLKVVKLLKHFKTTK